jgi:hypothetical protein
MAQSRDLADVACFDREKFKREGERLRAREEAIVGRIEGLIDAYERMTKLRFSEFAQPAPRRDIPEARTALQRAGERWGTPR